MSNIGLVIEREYLSRVRKVSFVVLSILVPIGGFLLMALPAIINMVGSSGTSNLAVVDRTSRYAGSLTSNNSVTYSLMPPDTDEAGLRSTFSDAGFEGYMVIDGSPAYRDSIRLYSVGSLPNEVLTHTEDMLCQALREEYLQSYPSYNAGMDSLFTKVKKAEVSISTYSINEDGTESENFAALAMIISIAAAMLIYMFVLITGSMVLQGVAEEKQNRIVEVLISSVKPFDLMMGKIIGIALVAFTQILIWVIFGGLIMLICSLFFLPDISSLSSMGLPPTSAMMSGAVSPDMMQGLSDPVITDLLRRLQFVNIPQLFFLFVAYFFGGYMVYASLFAIIGASIDSPSDAGALNLIVVIPMFLAIYISIHTMQDPNSALSVWSSIIPFTSPIVMMARLPFSVPIWQVTLSLSLLVATFVALIWIAARIYRVGILMYGKKASLKELVKWFRQAE